MKTRHLLAPACWSRWRPAARRGRAGAARRRRAGPPRAERARAVACGAAGRGAGRRARGRGRRARHRAAAPTTAARSWRQVPAPVSVTLTARALRRCDARLGGRPRRRGAGHRRRRRRAGRRSSTAAASPQLVLEAAKARRRRRGAEGRRAAGGRRPGQAAARPAACSTRSARWSVGAYGLALGHRGRRRDLEHRGARACDNPKGLHLYAVRRARRHASSSPASRACCCGPTMAARSFQRAGHALQGQLLHAELPADARDRRSPGCAATSGARPTAGANWTQLAPPVPVSITASAQRADGALVLRQPGRLRAGAEGRRAAAAAAPARCRR